MIANDSRTVDDVAFRRHLRVKTIGQHIAGILVNRKNEPNCLRVIPHLAGRLGPVCVDEDELHIFRRVVLVKGDHALVVSV